MAPRSDAGRVAVRSGVTYDVPPSRTVRSRTPKARPSWARVPYSVTRVRLAETSSTCRPALVAQARAAVTVAVVGLKRAANCAGVR